MAVTLTTNLQNKRLRSTTAQVNAAAGSELLPALAGYAYRAIDFAAIAIGGAAATATSIDIIGTRGGMAVRLAVIAVSAMSENTRVGLGHANCVILAAGASFTPLDANTPIVVATQAYPSAGNLATATHIDVTLTYELASA
jgi:hypothetical protein